LQTLKIFVIIKVTKDKERRIKYLMLPLNQNEIAALQMVTAFVPVRDLLNAAQAGFDDINSNSAKENADLCFKAIKAFLK
jgi:hypothetical protein